MRSCIFSIITSRLALRSVLSDMKRHRRMEEQILRTGRDLFQSDEALEKPSSPHSQRERDRDPGTVFSPRQRRY
uniref:Uncharacterized protein n=1 Tax=Cyprinus carpio TaxID=7962 RepID=A0A8C1JBL4_CYPCA